MALEFPEDNVWNALEEVWNGGGEGRAVQRNVLPAQVINVFLSPNTVKDV